MPEKRYLVTPGPTPVPPEVLAATAQPMIHHRGSDFRETLGRVIERLRLVFQTESEVLTFAASGTGAMESAVANLVAPGDRVLAVSCGKFGERWAELSESGSPRTSVLPSIPVRSANSSTSRWMISDSGRDGSSR